MEGVVTTARPLARLRYLFKVDRGEAGSLARVN